MEQVLLRHLPVIQRAVIAEQNVCRSGALCHPALPIGTNTRGQDKSKDESPSEHPPRNLRHSCDHEHRHYHRHSRHAGFRTTYPSMLPYHLLFSRSYRGFLDHVEKKGKDLGLTLANFPSFHTHFFPLNLITPHIEDLSMQCVFLMTRRGRSYWHVC